jgi:hypothetical protein
MGSIDLGATINDAINGVVKLKPILTLPADNQFLMLLRLE